MQSFRRRKHASAVTKPGSMTPGARVPVPVAPTGVRLTTPFLRRTLELLKLQRPPLPSAPARSAKPETQPRPLATLADACPELATLKLA